MREQSVWWAGLSLLHIMPFSPGSLGESLTFSPSSWVPVAVRFVTVILSRSEELLSGSVPASLWKEMREGEAGRSLVSRTFSHSVCIRGNNTFWTAGLQQGGVTMIYHPVVLFAVQSTRTHPHSPPAPLNLHPGYISLTQLCGCLMWSEPVLVWKSAPISR